MGEGEWDENELLYRLGPRSASNLCHIHWGFIGFLWNGVTFVGWQYGFTTSHNRT